MEGGGPSGRRGPCPCPCDEQGNGLTRNWKARVAYDGTRYAGFQVQPNAPTVQGELERALATICQAPVRVIGAGRTDAGVHASGQVISFRSATELDEATLGRGVNALLPADIAVTALGTCADDFHARFSATGRTYEYRIRNAAERDPLERHREHWVPDRLDDMVVADATLHLMGRRDFTAFAAGPRELAATRSGGVREVRRIMWQRDRQRDGKVVRFEIEADAFLRGMVRAIVGTLLWVARGKIAPGDVERIVAARDRSLAGPSAPANGLCLVEVAYGERAKRRGEGRDDDSDDDDE